MINDNINYKYKVMITICYISPLKRIRQFVGSRDRIVWAFGCDGRYVVTEVHLQGFGSVLLFDQVGFLKLVTHSHSRHHPFSQNQPEWALSVSDSFYTLDHLVW